MIHRCKRARQAQPWDALQLKKHSFSELRKKPVLNMIVDFIIEIYAKGCIYVALGVPPETQTHLKLRTLTC